MRRLRGEIFLFLLTLILCIVAVRALSQEASKLKPGDEVKATELESAKLGKLKAQLDRVEAQKIVLQQQFGQLQGESAQLQSKVDEIVKAVQSRVKAEKNVDVVYDIHSGEDGVFRVNPPSPPPPSAQATTKTTTPAVTPKKK